MRGGGRGVQTLNRSTRGQEWLSSTRAVTLGLLWKQVRSTGAGWGAPSSSLPQFPHGALGSSSESERHSVVSDSLRPHGLYSPGNSPGQNTGVGSLSFLQGIFLTQGSNPGLLHCRRVLYQLSHQGSTKMQLNVVLQPAALSTCRV